MLGRRTGSLSFPCQPVYIVIIVRRLVTVYRPPSRRFIEPSCHDLSPPVRSAPQLKKETPFCDAGYDNAKPRRKVLPRPPVIPVPVPSLVQHRAVTGKRKKDDKRLPQG